MKESIQLEVEFEKVKKDPQYIDYFSKLITQKLGNNQVETEKLFNQALEDFKNQESTSFYGELLYLQGKNNLFHGALNKSIALGKEAYLFFKSRKEDQGIIKSCYLLLEASIKKGDFESAAMYTLEALEHVTAESDHMIHLMILLQMAELYIRINEYTKAKQICHEVMEMSVWLTDDRLIFIESILLEICLKENNLEEAMSHCQNAYTLMSKFEEACEYAPNRCKILFLRAKLNKKKNLHMQAERDYKASMEIAQEYDLLEYQVMNEIEWSSYLGSEGRQEEAKDKIKKAIDGASEMSSDYLLARAYYRLSEINEADENWEEAFKSMKKGKMYTERMFTLQLQEAIEKLNQKNRSDEMAAYRCLYTQMKQVAKIGIRFTAHLEENKVAEVIHKEMTKLLDVDVMGIAFYKEDHLEYKLYDLQEEWLNKSNDLTKYTFRLLEHCMEYQKDIMITDGNFEEYSLKNIKNSQTGMKLQSVIVTVLKMDNKVIGAMLIGSYKASAYSPNDLNASQVIASYVAITLHNMMLYQKAAYLADHDALTGLLSRRVILKKGEKLFKETHKKHKKIAVIMFDTDYFKKVNDKYGHQLGDKVLRTIGKIMINAVKEDGYVGRYGGEEFLMILEEADHKKVVRVAEYIKNQLEETTFETKKDKNIKVTLSGGIYICDEYTLHFEDAIHFADHALYRAKISGRNRILSYHLSDIKE